MPDISIQFHALPEELLSFLRQIVSEFNLHVVALRFRPFSASEIPVGQFDHLFSDQSTSKRFHFSQDKPVLSVADELEFSDKNPDSLRLDVGSRGEEGLRESWLSARTENATALATWKKIAKQLKGMTVQGATAVNPNTGASGSVKGHRFTEGAKRLEAIGFPLLSITGIWMKSGLPGVEKS